MLVGGGHAHVEVVRRFGKHPEPGCRVTLVSRDPQTPYSGMLPGLVAGHYRPDQCYIDLPRLCRATGVRFVHGEAVGLDRGAKTVLLNGAPRLRYDVLSLNVGITPSVKDIEGAGIHALVVKPISGFLPKWEELLARAGGPDGPRRIAAVGGGPAGFELILAVRHRFLAARGQSGRTLPGFSFALVTGGRLLEGENRGVQAGARRVLQQQGVRLIEGRQAVAIRSSGLLLEGGERIEADAVLVSTGATAPGWLTGTGLQLHPDGFLGTLRTLQCANDPNIFAAGDCATILDDPRPKAGVFAVRQGPVLAGNIRRRLHGRPLARHYPQRRWLAIMTTGGRYAIAGRGPLKAEGGWVWYWKDLIDRRWIRRYVGTDQS